MAHHAKQGSSTPAAHPGQLTGPLAARVMECFCEPLCTQDPPLAGTEDVEEGEVPPRRYIVLTGQNKGQAKPVSGRWIR